MNDNFDALSEKTNHSIAVIIATRNRAEALEKYALSSLERSTFRDFICVVWDASDNAAAREVCESGRWPFALCHREAPRAGLPSQRNDAVKHVLEAHPNVGVVVFIDDDTELSADALDGVLETFRSGKAISIVNIPIKPLACLSFRARLRETVRYCLGMNRRGVITPFLYNYCCEREDETHGDAEWSSSSSMAVDVSVFRELHIFFPEAFQCFGGYALGEDLAFSFFVFKKLHCRIVVSLRGYCFHHAAGSARLDIGNMTASRWYNFHLLFDAIYDGVSGLKKTWAVAAFEIFMCASMLKRLLRLLAQGRFSDVFAWGRGLAAARTACRLYRREHDARALLYGSPREGGRK